MITTLSAMERSFFASMACAIAYDLSKNNAYTKFVDLSSKFAVMVNDLAMYPATHPRGHTARSISKQSKTIGVSCRDRLLRVCAQNMGWSDQQLNNLLERNSGLSTIAVHLSGGFLLLTD